MIDELTLARIMAKVSVSQNGCWIWTASVARGDYALATVNGKNRVVHRVLYEHFVGQVPSGLDLDHLCHTNDRECPGGSACPHRRCVNPAHMEPVTRSENNARSLSLTAENARKTECPRGHPYSGANLYVDKTGRRHCKECRRGNVRRHYKRSDGAAYMRAYRARKKAA